MRIVWGVERHAKLYSVGYWLQGQCHLSSAALHAPTLYIPYAVLYPPTPPQRGHIDKDGLEAALQALSPECRRATAALLRQGKYMDAARELYREEERVGLRKIRGMPATVTPKVARHLGVFQTRYLQVRNLGGAAVYLSW